MKNYRKLSGVTLAEMMVAVAITVFMLAAAGLVFRSVSTASGKALAVTDVMSQMQAFTQQLNRDFSGLRSDMPMAVMFEADGAGRRRDRLFFFASGKYHDIKGADSENLARIFYGQSADTPDTPNPDLKGPPPVEKTYLTRRQKIVMYAKVTYPHYFNLWPSHVPSPQDAFGMAPDAYDLYPFEFVHSEIDYRTFYMTPTAMINYYLNPVAPVSFVRRPQLSASDLTMQSMLLLSDISDFRIEVWFEDSDGWNSFPFNGQPGNAIYWNINEMDTISASTPIGTPPFNWWSGEDFNSSYTMPSSWPKALRISFKIYDKNRRHYPDGRFFSYIVELPQR